MIIWVIGMSASGKTTIGKKIYEKLKHSDEKWIFLDGDTFRNILGEDLGHTIEDRRKNAYRVSRFCEFLSSQNINAIACVLSIFHDNQKYNKNNIPDYKEVYIDVKFENLLKRDNKDLYKNAIDGKIKNVVGVDIKFDPPLSPDLILDNNTENPDYQIYVKKVIDAFKIKINENYIYSSKNLLKYPNSYQYSDFQGKDFLEMYKKDRSKNLDHLRKKLKKIKNKSKKKNFELKNKKYQNKETLMLKDDLIYLYNSNNRELIKQKNIIDVLIKRFEVSKKLFLQYEIKRLRKQSSKFDEILLYPLFSLVLQKYYLNLNDRNKLVFLNTILKVNDIISSISNSIESYDEIFYSIEAINGELNIIGENLK